MDGIQEYKYEIEHIKVEVLESDNPLFVNEETHHFMTVNIKNEEVGSESSISKYKSDVGDEIFTNERSLKDHVHEYRRNDVEEISVSINRKQHNDSVNNIKCVQPTSRVANSFELYNTECQDTNKKTFQCVANMEAQDSAVVYNCHKCGKSFKTHQTLTDHAAVHSDDKPFKCERSECTKTFKRRRDLYSHMKVHTDERPYKCGHIGCSQVFKRKETLEGHLKVHSDEKPFKCKHSGCTKSFKRISNLNDHLKVHSDKMLFKCDEIGCSRSFRRKKDLLIHTVTHNDEKPFKCTHEDCDKSFKSINYLKAHLSLHSDDAPFKCSYGNCEKAFKRKCSLKYHQRIHSFESNSSEETFACDYPGCSSTFRWAGSFNRHMRKHKLGRHYRCTFDNCNAAFYEKKDLRNHTRLHTGERFFCNYEGCGRSYTSKDSLTVHRKIHNCRIDSSSQGKIMKSFKNNDCINVQLENQLEKEALDDEREVSRDLACEGNVLENIYQCSICNEKFNEEKSYNHHIESCSKYIKCEFVDVDQINPKDLTVDVKLEFENIE